MSSQCSHSYHRPKRSSKHTKESRPSTSTTRRSATPASNYAQASTAHSHHNPTTRKSSAAATAADSSQTSKSASTSKPKLIHSNNPILITAANLDGNSPASYVQEYAASVLAGTSSLGIDVSPYLQRGLVDQHGQARGSRQDYYSYSTVESSSLSAEEVRRLDFDLAVTLQQRQDEDLSLSLAYVDNNDAGYEGYYSDWNLLAGVGAQFQG